MSDVHALLVPEGLLACLRPTGRSPTVEVLSGTVWLTQEGSRTDHILHGGSTVTVLAKGKVVIQAFSRGGARLRVAQARVLGDERPAA